MELWVVCELILISMLYIYKKLDKQAYFLRTMHTDPNAWRELIVITNKWHMPRVKAIFTILFSLPSSSSSSSLLRSYPAFPSEVESISSSSGYHIQFEEVADILPHDVLQLREKREQASLQQFMEYTVPLLHTLADAHHFLFWKHQAYSAERFSEDHVAETIDPELLKSY